MGLTFDFEWWQLWTCHLAHWDARHLLLNALAAVPPLLLLQRRMIVRVVLSFFAAAPLLSVMLIASGVLRGEYRGASGLVVALWFFAAITLVRTGEQVSGAILLAAVSLKVLAEVAGWWPSQGDAFVSLPAAHVAGALIGVGAGVRQLGGRLKSVSSRA